MVTNSSAQPLLPKRKSYTKIRGGCSTCKDRKLRCSLERPVCRNCDRASRLCVYTSPDVGQETAQIRFNRGNSQLTRIQEVELMHYYTAYTYRTLSNNPVLILLWKEVVPQHAFQHPFLLQGLLAIAAQHKLHDRKAMNSTYLIDAVNIYQREALASYIHLLNNITKDNCDALFAFSQVIVAISYSRLNLAIDAETRHPQRLVADIIDIFDLLKGALVIAEQAVAWLRAGDLAPMIGERPKTTLAETSSANQTSYMEALSSLSDHIADQRGETVESRTRVDGLLSTIQLLYTIFVEPIELVDKLNKIIGLPIYFDTHYLRLLKTGDQASLTILAYYGIALREIRESWCLDSVGAKLLHAIASLVSGDWSMHLP